MKNERAERNADMQNWCTRLGVALMQNNIQGVLTGGCRKLKLFFEKIFCCLAMMSVRSL